MPAECPACPGCPHQLPGRLRPCHSHAPAVGQLESLWLIHCAASSTHRFALCVCACTSDPEVRICARLKSQCPTPSTGENRSTFRAVCKCPRDGVLPSHWSHLTAAAKGIGRSPWPPACLGLWAGGWPRCTACGGGLHSSDCGYTAWLLKQCHCLLAGYDACTARHRQRKPCMSLAGQAPARGPLSPMDQAGA